MRTSPVRPAATLGCRLLAAILLAAAALPYAALAQTDVHNTATGGNWTAAATWPDDCPACCEPLLNVWAVWTRSAALPRISATSPRSPTVIWSNARPSTSWSPAG